MIMHRQVYGHSLFLADMALGGKFRRYWRPFLDSVLLDVESRLSGDFLGALDDSQLCVIEGSRCIVSPPMTLTSTHC